jgi:signal peptidase II
LSGAVLLLVLAHWRRLAEGPLSLRLALSLVAGGAIGNLIDRVRLGYVTDFVHVYWRSHVWPDFNVADSAISIGIVLLLLDAVRPRRGLSAAKGPLDETTPASRAGATAPVRWD